MSDLDPVTVTISGKHDTGRTTMANLLKMFLEENGYTDVEIRDVAPLPQDQKDDWHRRFLRNRERPILISIVTDGDPDPRLLVNNQALADGTPVLPPRSAWIPARASIGMTCCACIGEIDRDTIVMRAGERWAHSSCVKR